MLAVIIWNAALRIGDYFFNPDVLLTQVSMERERAKIQ